MTAETKIEPITMALAILHNTNDGNELAPHHLKLVEMSVNGFLNDAGKAAFQELYEQVKVGYKKPALHGIENLTIDHTGYVKWKGATVEHYNMSYAYSQEGKAAAEELARRCRILEKRGEQPTMTTAIWRWEG